MPYRNPKRERARGRRASISAIADSMVPFQKTAATPGSADATSPKATSRTVSEHVSASQYQALVQSGAKRKFRNQSQIVDGIWFPSKLEAQRWSELLLLQAAGHIHDLKRQQKVELRVNGLLISSLRVDFCWRTKLDDRVVYEDAKGYAQPDWIIKARLFEALFGYPILLHQRPKSRARRPKR